MRKLTFYLLALCLTSCLLSCSSLKSEIEDRPFQTSENIKREVEHFIDISKPNRTVGTKSHDAGFDYIKTQFESIAQNVCSRQGPANCRAKVFIHNFMPDIKFAVDSYQRDFDTIIKSRYATSDPEYKKWDIFTKQAIEFVRRYEKVKGRNIVLELTGVKDPNRVVYVGAHYDTITHNHETMKFTPDEVAPGADDNASAVVALLNAARDLAQRPHDQTIRFVAFDFEEIFFLGSYALAKDLSSQAFPIMRPNEKTEGLFNLEMIGWSQKPIETHPPVKLYTRTPSSPGLEADMRLAQFFQKGAILRKTSIDPVILQNSFNRSDNWPFWIWSFPAVCISEDWEKDFNSKNYHTSHDLPNTLNYAYIRDIMVSLIEGVEQFSKHSN